MITHGGKQQGRSVSGGMIFEIEENCFLCAGVAGKIEFIPKEGEKKQVEILRKEEGWIVNGEWQPGRRLNGDERGPICLPVIPGMQMIEVICRS